MIYLLVFSTFCYSSSPENVCLNLHVVAHPASSLEATVPHFTFLHLMSLLLQQFLLLHDKLTSCNTPACNTLLVTALLAISCSPCLLGPVCTTTGFPHCSGFIAALWPAPARHDASSMCKVVQGGSSWQTDRPPTLLSWKKKATEHWVLEIAGIGPGFQSQ